VEHEAPIAARAVARQADGDAEILALEVALEAEGYSDASHHDLTTVVAVDAASGGPRPLAFIERAPSSALPVVWVRRPRTESGKDVTGDIYIAHTVAGEAATPGHRFRFKAESTSAAAPDAALSQRWARSFADRLRGTRGGGPWHAFAADRLFALAAGSKKKAAPAAPTGPRTPAPTRRRGDDLVFLMETTTGVTSIQEALQHDRSLFVLAAKEKPSVPIAKIEPPKLAAYPFREMLAALGAPVPTEPLASAAPADFYFIRFNDLPALFALVDQLDAWATPLAHALDGRSEDRALTARYEAELGISRGPLSRSLGPEAIASVALVGSDPYLPVGSDVTAIFKVKSKALFEAGMVAALGAHAAAHGEVKSETATHAGATIRITRSADGAVKQHRAGVGDIEIVSNSLGATKAVLDAIAGKRARLSDEADFQYMLARDASVRADVLAFLSDRFVAEVIGPRQKILEARRQIALAELLTPPYASLLYGWMNGKSPASAEEITRAGLLSAQELKHGSGQAIAWKPGDPARSAWGSSAAMTPLIDLPAPTLVTEMERAAYQRFSSAYQRDWQGYIDPVMIRLAVDAAGQPGQTLTADVRILPILEGSEYREIERAVGSMRVASPPLASGARVVLGVSETAGIRRELGGFVGGGLLGGRGLTVDWLGDWAMVGVMDRTPLATSLLQVKTPIAERPLTQAEREKEEAKPRPGGDPVIDALAQVPLFAGIELKSTTGAALAIAAARAIAQDAMPGLVTWGEWGSHRSVPMVRVSIRDPRAAESASATGPHERPVNIYYAFCRSALLLSLKQDVMRALIDERLDDAGPVSAPAAKPGERGRPQFVLDIAPKERGPIASILMWLLAERAIVAGERSRAMAEALFRGDPGRAVDPAATRALSLALFGSAPVTPDGGLYAMAPEGVKDPARGSLYAPVWPAIPLPGSPIDKAISKLSLFHVELGFDDEARPKGSSAQIQSLHARMTLKQ
jgi:hypothetical protein